MPSPPASSPARRRSRILTASPLLTCGCVSPPQNPREPVIDSWLGGNSGGMTDTVVTPGLEELLQHAGWLRRLAARLVAGPHDADDLVQEV
ncbi:MAG: hypothetical protein KAI24_25625, partial [Planctomycetes bacterium]|nr:hypothetical protein [Planctomycetota bacterium]